MNSGRTRRFALLASCSLLGTAVICQASAQGLNAGDKKSTTKEISFRDVERKLTDVLSREIDLSEKDFHVRYSSWDIERIRRRIWDQTQIAIAEYYHPREEPRGPEVLHANRPWTSTTAFVAQQSDGQFLASKFSGTDVVGDNGAKVGDVSDVLFDRNNKVIAFIVGVGGFLGIGAKDVAVNPASFTAVLGKDSTDMKLRLSATKDELKAAVAFEPLSPPRPVSSEAPTRPPRDSNPSQKQ
jgi:sporulation protein YlmC with PRC-barrel domain